MVDCETFSFGIETKFDHLNNLVVAAYEVLYPESRRRKKTKERKKEEKKINKEKKEN